MKKRLSVLSLLLCAVVICLSFTACGNSGKDAKTESSQQSGDTLKVGMECNYAPYNWSQADDSNGAVAIKNVEKMYTNGYDVQVAKKIAESLGKKLEIYSYEWDSLVPAVQSGNLDMIIAGMSPTEERRQKIDFSDMYYISNLVVITKGDKLKDVKSISDLDGKKIAAQSGTSHLKALTEQTKAQVSELADFTTMLIALKAGTIDGYVAEEPTSMAVCLDKAYSFVPLVNNETGFKVPADDTSVAVGVKKGSELKEKINGYLKTFDTDAQKALMEEMVKIAPNEE